MVKKILNNLCEKIVIKKLNNIKYGNLILVLPNKNNINLVIRMKMKIIFM